MAKFSSPSRPSASSSCRPTSAHLHLWQQRTRSSCCTRSDRNWGRQRGRRILDSSSGRQGPLCSRLYLTQANTASKTCHNREGKLWRQLLHPEATPLCPPISNPLLPTLGPPIFPPTCLLNPLFSLHVPSYPIQPTLLKDKPRLLQHLPGFHYDFLTKTCQSFLLPSCTVTKCC